MPDPDKIRSIFLQLSVFGLVAALWLVIVTLWALHQARRRQQLERRLQFAEQGHDEQKVLRLWRDGRAAETWVPGGVRKSIFDWLEHVRQDAGWNTPLPKVLLLVGGITTLACVLVVMVTGRALAGAALAGVVVMVFRGHLLHCIAKRTALFEKQLVDALDLGARSLRAGHPLNGAFRLMSQEIPAPINAVFTEIVEQEALGVSLQNALHQVAQRSRSADMKIFAASVIIQLRSGGNLADMMDRVAWVIRDRMRLSRRARVLTSEAQLSKWVLLALPIGLFVVLSVMNRRYMEPFFNTFAGGVMLAGAAASLLLGAWVMSRMAKLKY